MRPGKARDFIGEDEGMLAYALEQDLLDAGYLPVGPFRNLETARRAASDEAFEIGVLDINLNGERSFPVAEQLLRRDIPFLFLSGYGGESIPDMFRSYPRLAKPHDTDELLRRLDELIRARADRTRGTGPSANEE